MATVVTAPRSRSVRVMTIFVALLVLIMLGAVARRMLIDVPNVAAGTLHHRRWMIRAFAVGIAVGTIRIWLGVFQGFGLLDFEDSFAPAFWISFSLHVAAAELWLRALPSPPD